MSSTVKRRVPRWVIVLAVLGVVGVCLPCIMTRVVFRAWKQEGPSMEPNLPSGARFFVAVHGEPQRGDIVVADSSAGGEIAKRVVGLPGDTVELREGRLFVDGEEITREVLGPTLDEEGDKQCLGEVMGDYHWLAIDASDDPATQAPVTVPEGHVYLLGDNRTRSLDSRELGPIPLSDLRGVLAWLYHPGDVDAALQCPRRR